MEGEQGDPAPTRTLELTPTSERCGECGFDGDRLSPADAAVALRSFARRYRAPLSRFLPEEDGDRLVRWRPEPGHWSALEYAAHVRDTLALLGQALYVTLVEEDPDFRAVESPDPDERALKDGYNEQDPAAVAEELAANAERVARRVDRVAADDWTRPAQFPPRGPITAIGILRHAVHEGSHHLLDIGRVLRAARAAGASQVG